MLILRGAPGSGKSRFVSSLEMESHVLSKDSLRLLHAGAEYSENGDWTIPQWVNEQIFGEFNRLFAQRIARGETLILDGTFPRRADWIEYAQQALTAGYEVAIVSFILPFEEAKIGNAKRPHYKRVPEKVVRNYCDVMHSEPEPSNEDGVSSFVAKTLSETDELRKKVEEWLTLREFDFSAYEKVVHIGDVHGCASALFSDEGPLANFNENIKYIFLGDLVDRGMENGELMRKLIPYIKKDNVELIWGNHEDHLFRYAQGLEAYSKEFRSNTLPQLKEAGVSEEDCKAILKKARPILLYRKGETKVCCTHAGLPGLPPSSIDGRLLWHLIPHVHLIKGAGYYSTPVDESWTHSAQGTPWIQVHGHRNKLEIDSSEFPKSFNLEGRVEFGGELRYASLSNDEWNFGAVRNHVFRNWRERFGKKNSGENMEIEVDEPEGAVDIDLPIPEWIKRDDGDTLFNEELLSQMLSHQGVLQKKMPEKAHISSLNFTRDVFFDKSWDDVVIRARGLFYDNESLEIVCRGYEKFFNVGERPETEMSALSSRLVFPITAYVKENGYLGNLGYDARKDELFFASKSTSAGDFAGWFKEIFDTTVPHSKAEQIRRYLRDAEASMVFEVVDPKRDPHMIEYDAPKLVLLDVFRRASQMERLPHDSLRVLGEKLGLEVKKRAFELPNYAAFKGWVASAHKDLSYRFSGKDVEGFVIEDSSGYMTKIKLPHYGFWKYMRSSKDRLYRLKTKLGEILEKYGSLEIPSSQKQIVEQTENDIQRCISADAHPMALAFMAWCDSRPVEDLSSDIISLRKSFLLTENNHEWLKIKWDRFDPSEKEPAKAKKMKM